MEKLRQELDHLIDRFENAEDFRARLKNLVSMYPFNEYEYIISTLLGRGKLTLDGYTKLRDAYIDRNLYLHIFEISAPRGFGDRWALGHLKELVPAFKYYSPGQHRGSEGEGQLHLNQDNISEFDRYEVSSVKIEVAVRRAYERLRE